MKKLISMLLCSLMVFVLVGCGSATKGLEGKWKRTDSGALNGMIINVVKTNEGYQATIAELTDNMKKVGYNANDVKWKEVKELSKDTWEYKDLAKTITGETKWYDMNMKFDENSKDTLKATDVASNSESGSVQTWERVK
ncbi:hypothetical protein CLPUN_07910 [Clostridium puniceum]|uniref:Lipoprotein n=1 Tax=Clostridium puniceum TaxID=29367 RepID=A0A1S8TWD1_9CLOT|nr:hypothetical protein [Clostridium puniceum]OOM81929.1 hypothetical protein CLPUN_07910 [Clostridium puniceum]